MVVEQLRIAILSVHSCPLGNPGTKDTGGMNVYVRELTHELAKQGLWVDIYTRVHDPEDTQIVELGQNARLIHLRAGEDEYVHKLAVYSYLPDFACNVENFRKRNDMQYDLVFSHYWLSGWAGKFLKNWWDVPHVMMFHTLGAVKNSVGIDEDEPELRIETERLLIRDCERIIAATEKEKEDLIRHYAASSEEIAVVPCGVNLDLFQPRDKQIAKQQIGFSEDKLILFVGRIEPLKGIDQLLRAMPYLENGHRLRLVIIGGGEHGQNEIKKLKKLSRDLHIEDSVTFSGLIKHEKLRHFYNAADVCVIPSYYESFGLVALESMACGTPVVATNVGDLKNIIHQGETGYVVMDNTPGTLANKINLLLSKSTSDMKYMLSIRASVTHFSWSNIARKIIEVCQEVVANHSA